ncbi:MAG TPA: hypothetical protein DCF71_03785 [Gemmatimonadetes bacterium]|nr:hypothetical protein [Gemmatimonadota bacterium]
MSSVGPSEFDWSMRSEIYRVFAETGASPTSEQLAASLHASPEQITASLAALYDAHEIAPTSGGSGVWMANPFSATETEYPVETAHMTCYANCAWDALGLPAILGTDGWTRTRCQQSGVAMEFGVRDGQLEGDDGVIHLVTPPRDAWLDIGFT